MVLSATSRSCLRVRAAAIRREAEQRPKARSARQSGSREDLVDEQLAAGKDNTDDEHEG